MSVERNVDHPGESDLDPKRLANFLVQLNIARRNLQSYPEGHPAIAATGGRVAAALAELLPAEGEFTLGVAPDALLAGGLALERKSPVYLDLARALFECGIAAVTFVRGLAAEEVLDFAGRLARGRDGSAPPGVGDDLPHIRVQEIRYDYFRVSEEEGSWQAGRSLSTAATSLWENLVEGLAAGTVNAAAEGGGARADLAPEELARILNERYASSPGKQQASYGDAIVSFMRQLDRDQLASPEGRKSLDRMGALVGSLHPELRSQFLSNSFQALADRRSTAEQLLGHLPEEVILSALEEVNEQRGRVSPVIVDILEKLSRHTSRGGGRLGGAVAAGTDGDLAEKLRLLFREEEAQEYVPGSYRADLQTLVHLDRIGTADGEEAAALKRTVLEHPVEAQVADIVLEILPATSDPGQLAALERNLLDLVDYFLEVGDYGSLVRVLERLDELENAAGRGPRSRVYGAVREACARPGFAEEALDGLALWGKERHDEIRALIGKVGAPFAAPLLDRLAEEPNRSLRRLYLDGLLALGPTAREAILARLGDKRWFVVRNLVLLLRQLGDPDILRAISRFIAHPHPQVRKEVLRTFLHFQEPKADQLLLRDLESSRRDLQLFAVQVAEFSRSPEVFAKLLACLQRGGLADFELDLKVAVVRTLAAIGNPGALAELARVLRSRSLLHPIQHQSLRREIVRSLVRYPADAVLPLLEELVRSDQEELARLAGEIRRQLQGDGR